MNVIFMAKNGHKLTFMSILAHAAHTFFLLISNVALKKHSVLRAPEGPQEDWLTTTEEGT